jgi:hypothetical protein
MFLVVNSPQVGFRLSELQIPRIISVTASDVLPISEPPAGMECTFCFVTRTKWWVDRKDCSCPGCGNRSRSSPNAAAVADRCKPYCTPSNQIGRLPKIRQ